MGDNYPDSMTLREYNEHFGEPEIDYEDSLCKICKRGKPYKEGCLCGNDSYLMPYEIPAINDECEDFEED